MPIPGGYSGFYLDIAALRLVLSGTENLRGTAAILADGDLQDAIDEAQTEVDGRLAEKYNTPFTAQPYPPLVVNITRDIAAYLATLTYRRGNPLPPGDTIVLRYQRAQTLLAQVVNGTVKILDTPTGEEAATSDVAVVNPVDGDLWTDADFQLGPATAGFGRQVGRWPW